MKNKKKRSKQGNQQVILLILLIVGCLIMLYPFYVNSINHVVDTRRMSRLEMKTATEAKARNEKMKHENTRLKKEGLQPDVDPFGGGHSSISNDLMSHLIGEVVIPGINAVVPIFDTTTDTILENGAGVLPGTSFPTGGPDTHSVISAHRGLAERKLFRDVDKVKVGDLFYMDILGERLAYEVEDIRVVLPNETDAIELKPSEDLVTLLTCTPYMINTHRLMITGHRVPYTPAMEKDRVTSKQQHAWVERGVFVGIALLFIVLGSLLVRAIKKASLKKHRVAFSFTYEGYQPGLSFSIYSHKGSKRPVQRDGEPLVVTADETCRVLIKDLPGGIYYLESKEPIKNRDRVAFGVKTNKEQSMVFFPTKKQQQRVAKNHLIII